MIFVKLEDSVLARVPQNVLHVHMVPQQLTTTDQVVFAMKTTMEVQTSSALIVLMVRPAR